MQNCRRFVVMVQILTILMLGAGRSAAELPKTLEIGRPAPDFNLPAVNGRHYRLADFAKAKILVIVFTCNHCPTAQAYEERINKLTVDYKKKGVALVAITPNDPEAVRLDELGYSDLSDSLEETRIRAKQRNFKFTYLYDGDKQKVSRAYGPVSTPHVFIFDEQRKLRYVGRVDDSEKPDRVKSHDARNAIEALLAGRPVPVEKTRTFGCSIKWSDKRSSVKRAFESWAKEPVSVDFIDVNGISNLAGNDSGKLRLINVWATHCPACMVEFPELVSINRMYRGREFEMVTISIDRPERKGRALEFLKMRQASSRNYQFNSEEKHRILDALDSRWPGGLPYTVLVKPGGEIIYRRLGLIDPLELKQAIIGHLGRYYK